MSGSVLRIFNLSVDGRGYAGEVENVTPPKLTIKTEDDRSGGRDAPRKLDVGMEALECSFMLKKFDTDVLSMFGLISGSDVPLTLRGGVDQAGETVPVVINLRGKFTELDEGEWQAGKKVEMKCAVACNYYKRTVGGKVVHEIDVDNAIRVVNGVDQMKAFRDAAGL
jgi:P2 family phage contractile tail tube protein